MKDLKYIAIGIAVLVLLPVILPLSFLWFIGRNVYEVSKYE